MPPEAMSVIFVADALGDQELVHLGDGVLDGHGDVLLGDVRGGAGAAIAAIQVDDVRAGVVAAHGHHVHVGGRGDLHAHQAGGLTSLIQSRCFLWSSTL